ncbi:reverse transcriptase family protein [Qipengyuania flava]|uniref:reverse transcriptase family protein n=1 Tax=Qipengyuania flava TaxID=192812 RepID=UPI002740030A|nr:reverse transcriptase family protein [Qipengyuania flava]
MHRTEAEFFAAYSHIDPEELQLASSLAASGLPPVTSREAIAVMTGLNPGFIEAMLKTRRKYYRKFTIKSGKKFRDIYAPRVGLKMIQSWLGHHFAKLDLPDHVHGFVPGRSHITAAQTHIGSDWAYAVDIENFFSTTSRTQVKELLLELGYSEDPADLIADLCTFEGTLPQGSPASPSLSNLVFRSIDEQLLTLSLDLGCRVTRYADDIVFSGSGEMPPELVERINGTFDSSQWTINEAKRRKHPFKGRIKIHGLLIKNDHLRLTGGYRNQIRAYRYLWQNGKVSGSDVAKIKGHLLYARHVDSLYPSNGQFDWTNFPFDKLPRQSFVFHRDLKPSSIIELIRGKLKR